MKSDMMKEYEAAMNEMLENISKCTREKDKEYFKNEYRRIKAMYDEEAANWLAIM